jgi:hypothetical protein
VYGTPRATQDADFVVRVEGRDMAALVERLAPHFRLQPQMTFEAVTATTCCTMQLVDSPFRIEFFLLSDDAHDRERFARRQPLTVLGRRAFVPTAEDVIVTKLRWSQHGHRSKDLDDVRGILAVQADRIQWDYVNQWCDIHGTRSALDDLRRSLPSL